MNLSDQANKLLGQPMFKVLAKTKEMERQGRKIIHFEIGDQNFPTPQPVISAAIESLNKGETYYTESMGLLDLRKAICEFSENIYGLKPNTNQVVVLTANTIIDYVIRCVANPGDEVIYPDPGFTTYHSVINYTGMSGKRVSADKTTLRVLPQTISDAITSKTKLVIVNSPNNPTGSVNTIEELEEIYDMCEKRGIVLLSDETYSSIYYGSEKPASLATENRLKNNLVVLKSFSKNYSMAGWRMGYALAPEQLAEKLGLMLQTSLSCYPIFTQRGAIEALKTPESVLEERRKDLKERRDLLVNGLNEVKGIQCRFPEGAFYVFADISGTGLNGEQFSNKLLSEGGVAILPGNCFGPFGENYVRMCFGTTSKEAIQDAIKIMKNVYGE
jgi:aspartate aminotransferase